MEVLQIGRTLGALMVVAGVLLTGVKLPAIADRHAGANPPAPVSVATILAAPEEYEGQQVVIRGRVAKADRAVFPNGRPYYTLSVGDRRASLTVFSWNRPPVKEGDSVQVAGVFHVWRYNIHHVVESNRITRLEKTL